jgi:putative transposase
LVVALGALRFDDLTVDNVVQGTLAKSILDAAWRQLIDFKAAKAAWAGRTIVSVNPRNTSKMCTQCGILVTKALRV